MSSLDELIELVVADAELVSGRNAEWMSAQGALPTRPVHGSKTTRSATWTAAEDAYLWANRPYLTIKDIAERLGRSEDAIKVRTTRIGVTTPRHAPGYISGNQIARLLGVDSHKPPCWIDLGILEGEAFPYPGPQLKRRVKISVFKRWLIRPTSWVYFDVKRIKNSSIRRLVELAQERWGDEWLSTRQAAYLRGYETEDILRQIKLGNLTGYQAVGFDRRRVFGWARWYCLRSEVERIEIPKGKGKPGISRIFTKRADEFILRAKAAGLRNEEIARMMKRTKKQVEYRYQRLMREA